jgi:hypothetical protein
MANLWNRMMGEMIQTERGGEASDNVLTSGDDGKLV